MYMVSDCMPWSRGYEESMDAELQEVFDFAISKGVTLFDTADSYGVPLTVHPDDGARCPAVSPLVSRQSKYIL